MNNFKDRLEVIANTLIILVALAIGGVLVQKYFFPTRQPDRLQPTVGAKVVLPNQDWSTHPKTVVLALQTSCHFCNDSAPFYKRLIEGFKDKNVRFVAVFPTKVEASVEHLKTLGVTGLEVKQLGLEDLQVGATPTLLLVNENGEITDFWVGKLAIDKELEVINKLDS